MLNPRLDKMMPMLFVLILLLSLLMSFPMRSVASSPTTYVKVVNPLTGDGNFICYQGEFIANITVVNVTDLCTWQLNITFNPTILKVLDIFTPTDHVFAGRPTTMFPKTIDNTAGYLLWGIAVGPPSPPDPPSIPFTGSGTLCQIRFNVTKTPSPGETLSSNITIDRVGLITSFLLNPDVEEIPFTEINGYYECSAPPPPPPPTVKAILAVDPPLILDPTMLPPKTFEVNITIANVTDLYGYTFTLNYNPNIIYCIGLKILDALNETNYIPEFAVNNTRGEVYVKVKYFPPAVPITTETPVALVKLTFRVTGIGGTPLDLRDTDLTDSFGRQISHDANDGYFGNLIRDLAVLDVAPSMSWAYQGWVVKINVTVRNEGEITETFDVKAYYDNTTIGTITVSNLNPGETITITFSWNTQSVTPCRHYTISAEAVPVLYELDLEDNYLTDGTVKIRFVGDVNDDGRVDAKDIALIIKAFGSYPGHPRWYPDADVNADLKIDAKDVALTLKNFGKACS